jgi:hypothetical protein
MNFKCPICEKDPGSHSFKRINETESMIFYYTSPAESSKYYDASGIVQHYDGELSTINKKWTWIVDCSGYELKHLMQPSVGIGLGKLISKKYSNSLDKICIINPNWYIYSMCSIVWPFLSKKIREKIIYDNEKFKFQENKNNIE